MILVGGTGGTLTANRLRRELGDSARIVVIDQDDRHIYQPGLLFVPFGLASPASLVRSRSAQLHDGIEFRVGSVDSVDTGAGEVALADGARVPYDVLVVATGADLRPDETDGLAGLGSIDNISTFYTLDGAAALASALDGFNAGRIVVNMIDLPVKCPVAPLEFCFLTDWFLRRRGVRDRVELVYVTPLDAAFTKPVASRRLASLLAGKGIALETEFATGQVDAAGGALVSWDERRIGFDLLVTIPLHGGAPFVERSAGLGDELGFVRTDRHTLQALAAPNVFAIGDATDVPTSKAGSVTHFQGQTLVENVGRALAGELPLSSFDGHTNCFVETGFGRALLIDFSYDVEPLPGRYPEPHVGPLPLLRESRLNHLAKRGFGWIYWHALLPGRDLPLVQSSFRIAGKDTALLAA